MELIAAQYRGRARVLQAKLFLYKSVVRRLICGFTWKEAPSLDFFLVLFYKNWYNIIN
jgi:hypothetical protein